MLAQDSSTRDFLAEAIRSAVDDVVCQHSLRLTQEPQITSKVAGQLEAKLNGMDINGYRVHVIAQDMPDRGPGSLEKTSGTDLFIGLKVDHGKPNVITSKGLLIQSKFHSKNGKISRDKKLVDQCGDMLSRSKKGAFVWLYSSLGTTSIPASEIVENPMLPAALLASRNIAEHFRDVLDCVSGDEALVHPSIFNDPNALNVWLREISAKRGVVINLKRND